jgi:uncharacterized membrane protein
MSAEWSADDQLLYESRVHNRQAVVAVSAGILLIAASIIQLSGVHTTVDELTLDLLTANQRFPLDLIAAVVNGIASLAMAWTLVYLYRAAKARNSQVRGFIQYLAWAAGGLGAVAGVVYGIVVAIKVHQFATTGQQTYDQAQHLTSGAGLLVLQLLGQLAALLMAVSFVLVCMQALRVGLLTKFMGYLGMFAGALVLFQITQVPVVQLFWLVALGYMISGRWPTGVPAAWRTGRAEAWPSGSERRARRVAQSGSGSGAGPARGGATRGSGRPKAGQSASVGGRSPGGLVGWLAGRSRTASADGRSAANGAAEAEHTADEAAAPGAGAPRSRANTPKRKRKRRH